MRLICFGMKYQNVSQIPYNVAGSSHYQLPAIDLCGEDLGKDCWRAEDGCYKVTAIFNSSNNGCTYFSPCDSNGNPEIVKMPNGYVGYATIKMVHDICIKQTVGHVYSKGEYIYQEGMAGQATGNHIHVEVAEGLQTTRYVDSNNNWRMPNEVNPVDGLYILDGYTSIINAKGLNFTHTSVIDDNSDNGGGGTDTTDTMTQINYQGGSNSLSNISTAFHVYAKTGTVPKMTVSKSTFNGSNITAVQIALDSNCQFINSYNPDGTTVKDAENNTYMTSHGYYCVASCNGGYFEATGDNRFKPVGAVMTDWNGKWSQYKGEDCVPGYQNGYPSLCYDDGKVYLVDLNADGFDLSKYHWINGVGQSEVIDYKVNCNVGYANGRYSQQNNTLSIGYDSKTNTVTFMINTASGLDTLNKAYVMQGLGCELATQLDGGISACLRYRADLVGQNTGNTDNQGDTTDLDAQISQLQTDIDTLTTERNNYKAKITNALNDLK